MELNMRTAAAQLRRIVTVSLALAAVACASAVRSDRAQPAPDDEIYLRVLSESRFDMAVYVVARGSWARVGTVTSGGRTTIRLSRALAGSADFQVGLDPIGSRQRVLLDPVWVPAGVTLEVRVMNYLSHSYWRLN
jgi:hypothetical protein